MCFSFVIIFLCKKIITEHICFFNDYAAFGLLSIPHILMKSRKEMILRGLSEDETFSKICENEDVKRLMEKLSSEV